MIELADRWKSVTDKEQWAARGASFMAKAKATKTVWFPPDPADSGKKGASKAKKATTGAAKKATGRTATKKATAAKKTASRTKS
jgi:hypothetical protein